MLWGDTKQCATAQTANKTLTPTCSLLLFLLLPAQVLSSLNPRVLLLLLLPLLLLLLLLSVISPEAGG